MKPEQQRIAIAEACGIVVCTGCLNMIDDEVCCCGDEMSKHNGWEGHTATPQGCTCGYAKQPQHSWLGVPDYLNDLNAMHDAEKCLPKDKRTEYHLTLIQLSGGVSNAIDSTAAQRAEAFLRTIGKWKEEA